MFFAALLTVAKVWKEHNCVLTDGCIKKCGVCMCVYTYIHTIEYYSSLKRKKSDIFDNMNELGGYYAK